MFTVGQIVKGTGAGVFKVRGYHNGDVRVKEVHPETHREGPNPEFNLPEDCLIPVTESWDGNTAKALEGKDYDWNITAILNYALSRVGTFRIAYGSHGSLWLLGHPGKPNKYTLIFYATPDGGEIVDQERYLTTTKVRRRLSELGF